MLQNLRQSIWKFKRFKFKCKEVWQDIATFNIIRSTLPIMRQLEQLDKNNIAFRNLCSLSLIWCLSNILSSWNILPVTQHTTEYYLSMTRALGLTSDSSSALTCGLVNPISTLRIAKPCVRFSVINYNATIRNIPSIWEWITKARINKMEIDPYLATKHMLHK